MKSLEEQYSQDKPREPMEVLMSLLAVLGIEERGGGPEGIYYTHPVLDDEYLFRNIGDMIVDLEPSVKLTDEQQAYQDSLDAEQRAKDNVD